MPAMAAYGVNGDFGYGERDLGGGEYEVTYSGATISMSGEALPSDGRLQSEQEKVRDLAMWRAADIAASAGFTGFRLQQETRDNDYLVRDEVVARPPLFPMYGYYGPYYHSPWWFSDDYWYDTRRRTSFRAKIKLRVTMLSGPIVNDPQVFDANALRSAMQAKRGQAVY
jgi:hypothetical protein